MFENRVTISERVLDMIRTRQAGDDPQRDSDKFAVYVNFDSFNIVHTFVKKQIATLADAGFRVVFITHSPRLPNMDGIRQHCWIIVHRRNRGYDFGGYRAGLRLIRKQNPLPAAVLLMNDSCYGFYGSIKSVESNVADSGVDLWGFTESYQHDYHVQSYFLLVSRRLFTAPEFWKFWDRLPLFLNREESIQQGEIGLSQWLLRSGFRIGAQVNYREAAAQWLAHWRERYGRNASGLRFVRFVENALLTMQPLNPTHVFWQSLLKDYGVPLVKRDLIRSNPMQVPDVQNVFAAIAEQRGDPTPVLEHLRMGSKRRWNIIGSIFRPLMVSLRKLLYEIMLQRR